MAAKGTEAKTYITEQILKTFSGSFPYDKEIRVPYVESDGSTVQIKLTLTCAKVNVEAGGDSALPGSIPVASVKPAVKPATVEQKIFVQPTAEEKHNVSELLNMLGL